MNATPADQRILLDLVDLDRRILVAEASRKNPPQAARIAELTAQKQGQSSELSQRLGVRDDVALELSRLESDVKVAQARRQRDQERLATASDPKQAVAFEHEITALTKRLSDLEDAELVIMERLEEAETAVNEQKAIIDVTNEEGARLTAEARELISKTTTELEELARDRVSVIGRIPEALAKQYDRVGAGLLTRNTCGACNMVLNATDLQEVRVVSVHEIANCPSCGAILVRTEESGL
ncbi:zinc ribbon domain-containing protein [Microbacterium sp. YY-03]|uniref:zinc ribbon domain-containing protein n=1 Tax=Microbacterium sp. YY-03 TaxID=3421636 RepID=UPI003D1652B9